MRADTTPAAGGCKRGVATERQCAHKRARGRRKCLARKREMHSRYFRTPTAERASDQAGRVGSVVIDNDESPAVAGVARAARAGPDVAATEFLNVVLGGAAVAAAGKSRNADEPEVG